MMVMSCEECLGVAEEDKIPRPCIAGACLIWSIKRDFISDDTMHRLQHIHLS
jgi:hypothetical protein